MKIKSVLLLTMISIAVAGCSNTMQENTETQPIEAENHQATIEQPIEEIEETTAEAILEPQYTINPTTFNVEPIADAPEKVVLLTFDDAPDKYALDIANILKELNVKAIFFVNGHFLNTDDEKEVLRSIHDMGFPIGNHTMNHPNLKKLSEEEQYNEIVKLNDLVESIIGERPKFYRAPFGTNTDYSRQIAKEENMLLMNWSYGYDYMQGYMEKDALANIMVNTEFLQNGANLLMHDRQWTKDAVLEIVTGLQAKDFSIVDPHLIKTP